MPRNHFDDEDDDDAFDERGFLKDGRRVTVPMYAMDSLSPVQQAIARSRMLCDERGLPLDDLTSRQPGFVCIVDSVERAQLRAEMRDYQKAELSARWKGGLQDGDHFRLGDREMEVIGRNPDTGKVQLADTSLGDAESIKQDAYDAYEADPCPITPQRHRPEGRREKRGLAAPSGSLRLDQKWQSSRRNKFPNTQS